MDLPHLRLWPRRHLVEEFASTLRMFGYDYVLSIEHEDSILSPEEGLTKAAEFLNGIVMRQQPAAAWWV